MLNELQKVNQNSIIVKEQDLHKPIAKGLVALEGQIDISATNILEQYETLKKQALAIQEKKRISLKIYEAEIKFEPIILGTYYLYKWESNKSFISMVGSNEWGRSMKRKIEYVAKIKLDYDHTWQILELNDSDFFI